MKRIALIGGSGFIGRSIANRLDKTGWQLDICTQRPPERLAGLQILPHVRLIHLPRLDAATLEDWFTGCDAVISMAGILHGSARQFDAVHAELPARIAAACQRTGIRRLVHISALGAAEDAPSLYQQSKAKGEAAIVASGLDWTILRPSVVFGRGDRFLTLFAQLNRKLPLIPLAGAHALMQPIWVRDVAEAMARVLASRDSVEQILDLAGPRRYSLADLVRHAGKACGHPRPVVPIPLTLGMLQAGLLSCLPGPPLMSRDNLRALQRDNISVNGFPGERLGFMPHSLETVDMDWLAEGGARSGKYFASTPT